MLRLLREERRDAWRVLAPVIWGIRDRHTNEQVDIVLHHQLGRELGPLLLLDRQIALMEAMDALVTLLQVTADWAGVLCVLEAIAPIGDVNEDRLVRVSKLVAAAFFGLNVAPGVLGALRGFAVVEPSLLVNGLKELVAAPVFVPKDTHGEIQEKRV